MYHTNLHFHLKEFLNFFLLKIIYYIPYTLIINMIIFFKLILDNIAY